jgi:O-antigen/teichoic acid export membrane protein
MAQADSPLREHVSVFLGGGVLTATRAVAGVARIKYVAFALGTAGVGLVSQAVQLQLLGIAVGSLSMAAGIINRMGTAARATPEAQRRLLSTALTIQLAAALLLVAVALTGARYVSPLVFGDGSAVTRTAFMAVILSVPFAVVGAGYIDAVLFGILRYDLYVRASMATTLGGTAATLVLISWLGLPGAFWGLAATSVLHCLFGGIALRRARVGAAMFRLGFHADEARALLAVSGAMLSVGVGAYLSRLWIQAQVLERLGADANGLLHVPLAITSYCTPLLSNGLWGRLHPAASRTGDTPEGRHELSTALQLTALVASTMITGVLACRTMLVGLAYSPPFLPAAALLPVQLVGDYCYFVAMTIGIYLLGVSRLRAYLLGWSIYHLVVAVVSVELIDRLGIRAVPAGYLGTSALLCLAGLAWFARRTHGIARARALFAVAGGLGVVLLQSILAARDAVPAGQFVLAGLMAANLARAFASARRGPDDVAAPRPPPVA